tara:strand:+ start:97 stop:483 length:387 start_codon:yes stop_codon:yes gene_type:complete
MDQIKVESFSWVDYGQSMRVNWWETNIELIINEKKYNLNIIKEEYLDDDGDGKGSGYRIKNHNGEILFDGLWNGWSRYDKVESNNDWKIGDEGGIDVWFKIEEEVENDNGWGFWSVEEVNEDYLKELF